MTSVTAMAGGAAAPCMNCGFGPSQSFRVDSLPSCTLVNPKTYQVPRSSPSQQRNRFRQARSWPAGFGCAVARNGGRVSMEYGGNVIRPQLAGERELLSSPQMLQRLRKQLLEAINMEDYDEAARVRDFINIVVSQDPVLSTREALEHAVSEERYDDAAKLRDELKDLTPPEEEISCIPGELGNASDTVTQNIRVRVRSGYVIERSEPRQQQYFFAYRIRISNEGPRTVQLLHRHWVITDAMGRSSHVRGAGVIGEQPVLRAGSEFEYTSACPLTTPTGKMEGEYQMIHVDSDDPAPFMVAIGPFALRMEDDDEESAAQFQ